MPNRLAEETSPYLLQHKDNPVDWYPWCDEALERAKAKDQPIFLSIGYSACHWCHVMEHESFENDEIASQLNEHFVCIKVDREERPDLDSIYMNAVQLMTGRGGWPMSVFLTPDLKPFYGGTYWPPQARQGMPGFEQVIAAVQDAWTNRREQAVDQAQQLTDRIREIGVAKRTDEFLLANGKMLVESATKLERAFDFTNGGFGSAPKFPHAMNLEQLLRIWHRTQRDGVLEMVTLNLDKMADGGIYDHLAGGFARYSVDERWLVPHFEKMLYDNALLTGIYLDAYVATGNERYADVVRETCGYVLKYMTDDVGGFHSAEDADSEGVEGKFYVWDQAEIAELLGAELAEKFCYVYDVTPGGNFEGHNILNLPKSIEQCAQLKNWDLAALKEELARARRILLNKRNERIRPGKDDKILVSWNAMMIDSMARAGAVLEAPELVAAAVKAAGFIWEQMRREDGRLLHAWRAGKARFAAYLDDYACMANALVTLYEVTFDESYIDHAVFLAETIHKQFNDPDGRGFFFTANDHETLIVRQKDLHDSSVPSGNGMAAMVFTRLGKLCGRADLLADARDILDFAAEIMAQSPMASGQLHNALDMVMGPTPEIVLLGETNEPGTADALTRLWQSFIPNRVVACRPAANASNGSRCLDPIFVGRTPLYGSPTVFVCQKFACSAPVSGKQATIAKWEHLVAMGQSLPDLVG